MNLEGISLRNCSEEKDKYHTISRMWNLVIHPTPTPPKRKRKNHRYREQIGIARGEVWGIAEMNEGVKRKKLSL